MKWITFASSILLFILLLPLHAQTAKPGPLKPDEIQEKHYKRPNLVKNGDFEDGSKTLKAKIHRLIRDSK